MYKELFRNDPRDYALTMVKEGILSADAVLLAALKYMSVDDVSDMLDYNEMSPRFDPDYDEDEDDDE